MIKNVLAAGILCLFGATAVLSAENMHESREHAMKTIAGAVGGLAKIAKGENPYDAGTVKASLTTIRDTIKVFPTYFPAGSENDDKEASPKIWANMDDFKAHAEKLGSDADMLLAQLPADQAAVGAALKTLGGDCGACHQTYRLKK